MKKVCFATWGIDLLTDKMKKLIPFYELGLPQAHLKNYIQASTNKTNAVPNYLTVICTVINNPNSAACSN